MHDTCCYFCISKYPPAGIGTSQNCPSLSQEHSRICLPVSDQSTAPFPVFTSSSKLSPLTQDFFLGSQNFQSIQCLGYLLLLLCLCIKILTGWTGSSVSFVCSHLVSRTASPWIDWFPIHHRSHGFAQYFSSGVLWDYFSFLACLL